MRLEDGLAVVNLGARRVRRIDLLAAADHHADGVQRAARMRAGRAFCPMRSLGEYLTGAVRCAARHAR